MIRSTMTLHGRPLSNPNWNIDITRLCWPTYTRTSLALGGDFSARFTLTAGAELGQDVLETWFSEYLGYELVESYAGQTAFRGLINTMRYSDKGDVLIHSLEPMANRIGSWYQVDSATARVFSGFTAEHSQSQALYGIKNAVLRQETEAYYGATVAEQRNDVELSRRGLPRIQMDDMGPYRPGAPTLEVEIIGLVQTLNWSFANNTNTSSANASIIVANAVDAAAVQYVTPGGIQANTTQISQEVERKPRWQRIRDIVALGSPAGPWLAGCYQSNRFDYFPADLQSIAYRRKLDRHLGRYIITDNAGQLIPDALVLPGRVVFNSDVLASRILPDDTLDDPRAAFIDAITYSAAGLQIQTSKIDSQATRAASLRLAMAAALADRQRLARQANGLAHDPQRRTI
jgi:hypothetical protein